ncbi:hypothetical protein HYU07_05895 [Candidatus Woesearchaeota archaeon]|nr:hypothetical protein [Candidatus Woesearchaeota archaeon]
MVTTGFDGLFIVAMIFLILTLFDAVMKGIGMWKAAKNNHLAWFICIFIFNTIGILPIIYLAAFQPKMNGKKGKDK